MSNVDIEIDEASSKELDTLLIVCAKNLCFAFLNESTKTLSEHFHIHGVEVLFLGGFTLDQFIKRENCSFLTSLVYPVRNYVGPFLRFSPPNPSCRLFWTKPFRALIAILTHHVVDDGLGVFQTQTFLQGAVVKQRAIENVDDLYLENPVVLAVPLDEHRPLLQLCLPRQRRGLWTEERWEVVAFRIDELGTWCCGAGG